MDTDAQAQAAIQGLNGREHDGRNLTVNEAKPREARSGGGGGYGGGRSGGGGGYGGGRQRGRRWLRRRRPLLIVRRDGICRGVCWRRPRPTCGNAIAVMARLPMGAALMNPYYSPRPDWNRRHGPACGRAVPSCASTRPSCEG